MKKVLPAILLAVILAVPACSPALQEDTAALTQNEQGQLAPPTITPPPTATPQGTATDTPEPSATPTETFTPGPSPTATAPQLPEGDPRTGLDLSVPDYEDNYTIQFQWGEFISEGAATNLLEDERMRATDHSTDTFLYWSKTDLNATNFYAQIEAEFSACSGKDSAGFGFRLPLDKITSGYTLEVSCDGMYRVRKFLEDAPPVTLVDWTASPAIHKGEGAVNLIGINAFGPTLTPIINETALDAVEDYTYLQGTFGIFSNAYETVDLTVFFDNFRYWYAR